MAPIDSTAAKFLPCEFIVLDFETTGLFPTRHRVIEVGAIRIRTSAENSDGMCHIVDSFSSLCNPGKKLNPFIVKFTGISDAMLLDQPTPEEVMVRLKNYIGDLPIIAHNASFDSKFLATEMLRIGHKIRNPFMCTLLLSRRLFPDIKSHKLSNLQKSFQIEVSDTHQAHRAYDDAFVTVSLFNKIVSKVSEISGRVLDVVEYQLLSKQPKANVIQFLQTAKVRLSKMSHLDSFVVKSELVAMAAAQAEDATLGRGEEMFEDGERNDPSALLLRAQCQDKVSAAAGKPRPFKRTALAAVFSQRDYTAAPKKMGRYSSTKRCL